MDGLRELHQEICPDFINNGVADIKLGIFDGLFVGVPVVGDELSDKLDLSNSNR